MAAVNVCSEDDEWRELGRVWKSERREVGKSGCRKVGKTESREDGKSGSRRVRKSERGEDGKSERRNGRKAEELKKLFKLII